MQYTFFCKWIHEILPKDKADRLISLIQWPLASVDLTESIFIELKRIFESQNSYQDFRFRTPDYFQDWVEYNKDVFSVNGFIREEVFEAFKSEINSIVVVDLPREQDTSNPQPYAFVLSVEDVLEAKPIHGGGFEYVIYRAEEDGQCYVIDDESYKLYDTEKKRIISEAEHDLGYCPAHFLWNRKLSKKNEFDHKSPLTPNLGRLNWYLFFFNAKNYNDLSSAFPIYITYEAECDYSGDDGVCESGYLDGHPDKPCPKCSKKTPIGPGSLLTVPAPLDREDADMNKNPVTKVGVDKGSLDYCSMTALQIEDEIRKRTIGVDHGENVDVAKNKAQVSSLYESKTNVLMNIKLGFEIIHKWTADTIALLRYGRNTYHGSEINYGSEFYLATVDDLYDQYGKANKFSLPDTEKDSIYGQITETKYRNSFRSQTRTKILNAVEPYAHKSIKELLDVYKLDASLLNKTDFVIKLNFDSFVKRFELENGPIEDFGRLSGMDRRVKSIYKTFERYAKDKQKNVQPETE